MTPFQYLLLMPAPTPAAVTRHICADDGDLLDTQTCQGCKLTKPISEFHFRAARGDYYKRCRECYRAYKIRRAG